MAEGKKIAIIGAGGWGTALSIVLGRSRAPHRIALWAREQDVLDSLRKERKNPAFLPGFTIPAEVAVTGVARSRRRRRHRHRRHAVGSCARALRSNASLFRPH